MRYASQFVIAVTLTCGMVATVLGQASQPASKPASKPADEVAVIVNGKPIMESQIDEALASGRTMPKEQMASMRQQFQAQAIDFLINNELIIQEAKKAEVTVSDKELDDKMNELFDGRLKSMSMSREDAGKQITATYGKSLDEWLKERARSESFKASLLRDRLIEKKYAKDLKVTDEDVKNYYDQNLQTKYMHPDQVKASHILFGTMDPKTRKQIPDEAKKEQKKKAEEVLPEVKKPGADFAALARKYSSCPSKTEGGDLGFFARDRMVKPFSDAAFGMKVGEISGIVESEFGYHIIKVTDTRPAGAVSFDEVKKQIRDQREEEKTRAVQMRFKDELKKDAKIVYPPGKELATRPATPPRPPMTTRPAGMSATRPAGGGQIRVVPPAPKQPQK